MQNYTTSEIFDTVLQQLQNKSLVETLEIVANILIHKGCEHLPIPANESLNAKNLLDYITKYRKTHGESLPVASVFQGLTILLWLDNNMKNKRE